MSRYYECIAKLNNFVSNDVYDFISGHFPGQIIIPGGILLEIIDKAVSYYLRSYMNMNCILTYIEQATFYSPITEFTNTYLMFRVEQKMNEIIEVDGVVKKNDRKIVKVRMKYKNEQNSNCHIRGD